MVAASRADNWQEINEKAWELIPTKKGKEPDEVDQILDQVEQGKIIRYPPTDQKDLAGKRLALGRRAKKRGVTIEMRGLGEVLAVRKVDPEPLTTSPETQALVESVRPSGEEQTQRRARKASAGEANI
jgi:hypothetical protein